MEKVRQVWYASRRTRGSHGETLNRVDAAKGNMTFRRNTRRFVSKIAIVFLPGWPLFSALWLMRSP